MSVWSIRIECAGIDSVFAMRTAERIMSELVADGHQIVTLALTSAGAVSVLEASTKRTETGNEG